MKKQPERMCVSCRTMHPKKTLIRLVLSPQGEISLDPGGKKPGRGAYVCRNRVCLQQAIRQHRFDKNLKARVDETVIRALTAELEALPPEAPEAPDGESPDGGSPDAEIADTGNPDAGNAEESAGSGQTGE